MHLGRRDLSAILVVWLVVCVGVASGKCIFLFSRKHLPADVLIDEVVVIGRCGLLLPYLDRPERKLLHEDVPVIQIGVTCAFGDFFITQDLLRRRSKSRKTLASALLGRLPLDR